MPWLMNKTRPADTDADAFEAADTPTPPHPDPRPEPEPPRPEPAYEDPRNTATEEEFAPGQEGRLLWVLPAVMTLASAVFTLWSVWDLATGTSDDLAVHAAGLAAGVVVEGGWVWMLILAHRQAATGRITTWNAVTGWILAVVTALILLAHGIQTGSWGLGLLAGLPLIAKAAWHGLTTSRAEAARVRLEAKQKEAKADDDSLTVAQRQRLAELRRQAKFTAEEAKALRELNDAQARAKHEAKLAQTNRETQQAMAQMEATAGLMVRKAELEERIELASPLRRQALALGSGFFAPDDASALGGDTGMGFASAMAQARMQAPTVRTGPDQEVPRVPGKVPTPTVQTREHPSVVEARRNRAACGQAFQELLEELGEVPSIAAVATAAGVSDRAAGRHLRALGLIPPASKSTD